MNPARTQLAYAVQLAVVSAGTMGLDCGTALRRCAIIAPHPITAAGYGLPGSGTSPPLSRARKAFQDKTLGQVLESGGRERRTQEKGSERIGQLPARVAGQTCGALPVAAGALPSAFSWPPAGKWPAVPLTTGL